VFRSYFTSMSEAVAHEKLSSPEKLIASRKAEHEALQKGGTPIDTAIAQLGRQGRAGATRANGVDITPQASEDIGPLAGWSKMPRQAVAFGKVADPTETVAADAGAEATADTDGAAPIAPETQAADAGAAPSEH
jgi:hypothetical protein